MDNLPAQVAEPVAAPDVHHVLLEYVADTGLARVVIAAKHDRAVDEDGKVLLWGGTSVDRPAQGSLIRELLATVLGHIGLLKGRTRSQIRSLKARLKAEGPAEAIELGHFVLVVLEHYELRNDPHVGAMLVVGLGEHLEGLLGLIDVSPHSILGVDFLTDAVDEHYQLPYAGGDQSLGLFLCKHKAVCADVDGAELGCYPDHLVNVGVEHRLAPDVEQGLFGVGPDLFGYALELIERHELPVGFLEAGAYCALGTLEVAGGADFHEERGRHQGVEVRGSSLGVAGEPTAPRPRRAL